MLVSGAIERKRKNTVFRGITADARKLRVSRVHLWMVLTNRRESKPLLARYHALKTKAGKES